MKPTSPTSPTTSLGTHQVVSPEYARHLFSEPNYDEILAEFDPFRMHSIGEGMTLYFWYLKKLLWLFFVMSLFVIPSIVIAIGRRTEADTENTFYYYLFSTSIGSLEFMSRAESDSFMTIFGKQVSGSLIAYILTGLDVVSCLIFLFYSIYMTFDQKFVIAEMLETKVSISDYAVEVSNLPSDATEDEIFQYDLKDTFGRFAVDGDEIYVIDPGRVLRLPSPVPLPPMFPSLSSLQSKRNQRSLMDPVPTREGKYRNSWIHEITLIFNGYYKKLDLFSGHAQLITEIQKERARVSKYSHSQFFDAEKLQASQYRLSRKLIERDRLIKKSDKIKGVKDVIGAIVVFSNLESQYRCLKEFSHYNPFFSCCKKVPEYLLFRGTHQLTVKQAKHPTDYNWENFGVHARHRCVRQSCTGLVTIIVLLISVVICSFIQQFQNVNTAILPDDSICRSELPKYTTTKYTLKPGTSEQNEACQSRFHGKGDKEKENTISVKRYAKNYDKWFYLWYNDTALIPSGSDETPCYTPCTSPATFVSWECDRKLSETTDTRNTKSKYHISSSIGCHCRDKYSRFLASNSIVEVVKQLSQDDLCVDFVISYSMSYFISFAAVLVVLIVNTLIYTLFSCLGNFERHKSVSSQTRLTSLKIFIALFISTAFIILITTSRGFLGRFQSKFLSTIGLFGGIYDDFTPAWYKDVGASLLFTMILNIITTNLISAMMDFCLSPCRRCNARNSILEKDILNSYLTTELRPEFSLPKILNFVFVCLLYSGGLPLMVIVGFLSLLFRYVVDVYYLFHSRKPPVYNMDLMSFSINILPLSVILHFAFACWMVSYPNLFFDSTVAKNYVSLPSILKEDPFAFLPRISRVNGFVYFCLLAVCVVVWLLYKLFSLCSCSRKVSRLYRTGFKFLPPLYGFYTVPRLNDKDTSLSEDLRVQGFRIASMKRIDGTQYPCIVRVDAEGSPLQTINAIRQGDFSSYNLENIKKYHFIETLEKDFQRFYSYDTSPIISKI